MKHTTLNRSEQWEKGEIHTKPLKAFGPSSNGRGMAHITIIPHDTRPYISQRRAINTTTEKLTSLRSFSPKI